MADKKVLLLSGGGVHDWKGCGEVIHGHLESVEALEIEYIQDDLEIFRDPELSAFAAVVFYYTGGDISDRQLAGLFRFVSSGGAFVGVHGATASFKQCDAYRGFIGGYLTGHPAYRQYMVSVLDREHPVTEGLDEFLVTDEQYLMSYDARVNVLATALYQGQASPVLWTRPWGCGSVVYLALGHDVKACQDPHFALLLQRAVCWTAGV